MLDGNKYEYSIRVDNKHKYSNDNVKYKAIKNN